MERDTCLFSVVDKFVHTGGHDDPPRRDRPLHRLRSPRRAAPSSGPFHIPKPAFIPPILLPRCFQKSGNPRRPLPAGARETPTSRARQYLPSKTLERPQQTRTPDSAGPEVTVRTGPVCYWWPAACCRAETSREAKSHSPNRSGTQNPSTSSRRHKGVIDRNVPSEFLIPELSRPASPQARFADWLRPASFRGCFPSGVANTAPGFPTQIPFLGCGSTFREQSRFQP
jgi:hypothetical protein